MKYEPLLTNMHVRSAEFAERTAYPFLPLIKNIHEIEFTAPVTFFIGENGSGKSTILEIIAHKAGFGLEGGSKNINFSTVDSTLKGIEELDNYVTLSWRRKPRNGYFFRAESFFTVANQIDQIAREDASIYAFYGGKSLHAQSHGESFLSFFKNRLGSEGFFVFDEPEAALSPQRQLTLLSIIHELCKESNIQFIIATHSPIILAYPNAVIYSCNDAQLTRIGYEETEHYQITRNFLNNPEQYFAYLFEK